MSPLPLVPSPSWRYMLARLLLPTPNRELPESPTHHTGRVDESVTIATKAALRSAHTRNLSSKPLHALTAGRGHLSSGRLGRICFLPLSGETGSCLMSPVTWGSQAGSEFQSVIAVDPGGTAIDLAGLSSYLAVYFHWFKIFTFERQVDTHL